MPGARSEAMLLADKEISILNMEDVGVIWGDANDINIMKQTSDLNTSGTLPLTVNTQIS
jgi:hypothetical protein